MSISVDKQSNVYQEAYRRGQSMARAGMRDYEYTPVWEPDPWGNCFAEMEGIADGWRDEKAAMEREEGHPCPTK